MRLTQNQFKVRSLKIPVWAGLWITLVGAAPNPADASLVFQISNVRDLSNNPTSTFAAGSGGRFDVELVVAGVSENLSGFNATIDPAAMSVPVPITYASGALGTSSPYVFGNPTAFGSVNLPTGTLTDISENPNSFDTLTVGTYNAGTLDFVVNLAAAGGSYGLNFDIASGIQGYTAGPPLDYPNLAFTTVGTTLNITTSAAPEPSTWALGIVSIATLTGISVRRRRQKQSQEQGPNSVETLEV